MREAGQSRQRRPMWRAPLAAGFVLALALFGAAGVVFYSAPAGNYLSDLAFKMNDYFGIEREDIEQAKGSKEIFRNDLSNASADIQTPPAQGPTLSAEDKNQDVTSHAQREKVQEPQTSATAPEAPVSAGQSGFLPLLKPEQPDEYPAAEPDVESAGPTSTGQPLDKVTTDSERQNPIQISEDPEILRRKIQIEIYKAIHNRAITGVNASLIDGVAYLDGEVATERQKLAAEQAARSVPGVDYVRNRIAVK